MAKKSKWAANAKKAEKHLKEAAKSEPSQGFLLPEGSYIPKINGECVIPEKGPAKGESVVYTNCIICEGELEGRNARKDYRITQKSDKGAEVSCSILVADLKLCLPDLHDEIEEGIPEGLHMIEEFVDNLNEMEPVVRISVVHEEYTHPTTGKKGTNQRIYFNDLLDDYTPGEEDDEDTSDDTEDEEEPTEDEADDSSDDDSSSPEKGDWFEYQGDWDETYPCEVVSINKTKQTVNLKAEDGDTVSSIPWSELGQKFDEAPV